MSELKPFYFAVVGISQIAEFLQIPVGKIEEAAACTEYRFGTNEKTLMPRDEFITDVLEPSMDQDYSEEGVSVIAKLKLAIGDSVYIDLEN